MSGERGTPSWSAGGSRPPGGRPVARGAEYQAGKDGRERWRLKGSGKADLARNRTAAAVELAVPFEIACQAVAVTWYATAGHDPADLRERCASAPWYASKAEPATADMGRQAPPRHHRRQV